MVRKAAWLLVLLMVASTTAQSESTAQRIDIDGPFALVGGFALMEVHPGTNLPWLHGTAATATVELRESTSRFHTSFAAQWEPAASQTWDFSDLDFQAHAEQDDNSLAARAEPGAATLSVQSENVALFASDANSRPIHDHVNDEPAAVGSPPLSTSQRLIGLDDGTALLEGDFLLVLHGWTWTSQHAEGSHMAATGFHKEPLAPGPGDGVGTATRSQLWIELRDAQVTLPMDTGRIANAYTLQPQVAMDPSGSWTLDGVDQEAVSGVRIGATEDGRFPVAAAPEAGQQWLQDSGYGLDGTGWLPTEPSTSDIPWAVALLVPAVVGVWLVATPVMRWRMRRGDFMTARWASTAALWSPWRREAIVTRTVCDMQLGRPDRAQSRLNHLGRWARPDAATVAFLSAHIAASCSDSAKARNHLARCLDHAPQYRATIQADPLLAPLLEQMHDGGYS